MSIHPGIKKVLLLGSGALKIGEAGEFDYSGAQAIKALREEGIQVVLINPNIATVQTSPTFVDRLYFLPIRPEFVSRVIEVERPNGILLSFGGQTALNCGIALMESGILEEHGVQVLGTPIESIQTTEDRTRFKQALEKIGLKIPRGKAVSSVEEGLELLEQLGYPVIMRSGFTLGGEGSGICWNRDQFMELSRQAFSFCDEIMVEEYLYGWKEIEYEVVRDSEGNCITVCNMENMDPLGIHTGESVVVAPSQTLTNEEYFRLREISIQAIKHLGIVGECNIQFALNSQDGDYRVIEVNARLSRSSALASKATGYPLAHIACKLALGYSLLELKNQVTLKTSAYFEPALDYLVIKIPRWDLNKFQFVSKEIGSSMKSVGEVMAIGRTFGEAFQKAIRMLNNGVPGIIHDETLVDNLDTLLSNPTEGRFLLISTALSNGYTVNQVHKLTGIDPWFINKINNCVKTSKQLCKFNLDNLPDELFKESKQLGFSDNQIATFTGSDEKSVRSERIKRNIIPVVKQIDTLAAEYPARTNYLYLTYNGNLNDVEFPGKNNVMVLGSGPYCIGSSVEFDWCCVMALDKLKELGYQTIMVNCNPETVSTDYDVCDRLYFEELSLERVMDIFDKETPFGTIVSLGGQIPNNLAHPLKMNNISILGTDPGDIDRCENRYKFSEALDRLNIDQPPWKILTDIDSALNFAETVGYPVLLRPSYVLSGASMRVAMNENELNRYLTVTACVSEDHPAVISKFIEGARELEIDAVADQGKLKLYALTEHIEKAGVHSGDATVVLPPQKTFLETFRRIKIITRQIAREFQITGPFNIQFLAVNNRILVIECNLRASRSFPFVSKTTGYNFIHMAIAAMVGNDISGNYNTVDLDYVAVKAPQFSFSRLKGADPIHMVEMASTGEVACFGECEEEAFLKSILSTGFRIPPPGGKILLSIGKLKDKIKIVDAAHILSQRNYKLYTTAGTHNFLKQRGIKSGKVYKIQEKKKPSLDMLLGEGFFDLIINTPRNFSKTEISDGYLIRRKALDFNIPLVTDPDLASILAWALEKYTTNTLSINEYRDYLDT